MKEYHLLMSNEPLLKALLRNKLFSDVDEGMLMQVSDGYFAERFCPVNTVLARQDEPADEIFLIVSGEVKITMTLHDNQEVDIVQRTENDYVGEMVLIEGDGRAANIICVTDCEIIVIKRADFFYLLSTFPEINRTVARTIALRLRETMADNRTQVEQYLELMQLHRKISEQKRELEDLNKLLIREIVERKKAEEELKKWQEAR